MLQAAVRAIAKRFFDAQKIGDLKKFRYTKSNMSKLYASAELAKAFKGTNQVRLDGLLQSLHTEICYYLK